MANKWVEHLQSFVKHHPEMSYGEAMKAAKKTYKKHDIMDKKHDAERDKEHKKANTSRRYKGKYGAGQADPLGSESAATPIAAADTTTAVGAARKGIKKAKTMKRAGAKKGKSRKH